MAIALETIFNPADFGTETVPCNLCGSTDIWPVTDHDRYGFPASIVECRHCHLIYTSPRMTADGFAAFYRDGYRPLVEQWRSTFETVRPRSVDTSYPEALIHFAKRWLPSGGHLLDVGGSIGNVSRYFAQHYGYDVTIVDPSPSELSQADGHRVDGGIEDVEFKSGYFDVILCCHTLDHLLDPKGALEKMGQWLAPTGVLLLDVMNVPAWNEISKYKLDHPYAFSMKTALKMIRATGWTVRRFWRTQQDRYVGFVCTR